VIMTVLPTRKLLDVRSALLLPALCCAITSWMMWERSWSAMEEWTKNATSTPGLLMRAVLVQRRNRGNVSKFAARLHASPGVLAHRTIIVTGGTSGLGTGIVGHLAAAGARLVLPYRRVLTHDELTSLVADYAATALLPSKPPADLGGHLSVEGIPGFDLNSFDAIERCVTELVRRGVLVDAVINNAGLVPISGRVTEEGFEQAFGVNFLGTALFTQRLREAGILASGARVVMVGSEEHRQHSYADLFPGVRDGTHASRLGVVPLDRGVMAAMPLYGQSKLHLNTFAHELARRWHDEGISVFDICPGPVASDIARDAPWWLAWLVKHTLAFTFPSPFEAALPVVALAVEDIETLPGGGRAVHHHMSEARGAGGGASDPAWGSWLWDQTQSLLAARAPAPP